MIKVIATLSVLLLLISALLVAGVKPGIVASGSMEPTIETGSLIFYAPAESYAVGDVIVFWHDSELIAHRIVAEQDADGDGLPDSYLTKGDCPEMSIDDWHVNPENIEGRIVWTTKFWR
jgi:signal peptidase